MYVQDYDSMLNQLVVNIRCQCMYSNTQPVPTISVYGLSIRTYNDTESSHRILNVLISEPHVNIYKLINILYEIIFVCLNICVQ